MSELDQQVRSLLARGETGQATTIVLRALGPELYGFLVGVLEDADADEVFSAASERLWRSLDGFEGRCSVRTWVYVLARHELGKFRKGQHREMNARVPLSEIQEVLAIAKTVTRSTLATGNRTRLTKLRDELPEQDRMLLVLRVDRGLSWDEIALAFADDPDVFSDVDRKRESARLRKRFQLIKERLLNRLRAVSLSL